MKVTLSCKFKLWLSQEQKRKLIETAKAYTNAINFVLSENLKDKTTNVKNYINSTTELSGKSFLFQPSWLSMSTDKPQICTKPCGHSTIICYT